jgi:iduronate 2-sulfatase
MSATHRLIFGSNRTMRSFAHGLFRQYAVTVALAVLAIGLVGFREASADPAGDRPNILFIAVDDLRPELDCYATRAQPILAMTPRLDGLAKSGMLFSRAYCNQAVCGASRLSLMTGLYPEFTGERTYHVTGWRKRWPHVVTMNQHFKANGYAVVGLGKIYHGAGGPGVDPKNWSEWIQVRGKEYANPESMKHTRETKNYLPGGKKTRSRGPCTEAADVADDVYSDGMRALEGARQIKQLAAANKPFFLAVGFTKPHLPFNAPTKYWDLYQREEFALPENLSWPPGYPEWARNRQAGELRAYSDVPVKGTPADFPNELNNRMLHGYHACVSYTDSNVGKLLDALETANVADNTVVVFWADHGWKLGDHSSWCKHTNFECDTRVPLMIRHPKIAAARGESKALVELIDLYPTLCELCGLDLPKHLQGESLVPILKDPAAKHRDYAYSSYPHTNSDTKRRVVGHSIRNERVRYTEWWEKGSDKVVARVATDIQADPGETTNLLPEQKALANQLSADLKRRVLAARETDLQK